MRRDIGKHVWDLFEEGERRPLVLGNKAIQRMERQIDAELELCSEQLDVIFGTAPDWATTRLTVPRNSLTWKWQFSAD